jgi:hypothetical protein
VTNDDDQVLICQALDRDGTGGIPWVTLVLGAEMLAPKLAVESGFDVATAVMKQLVASGTTEEDAKSTGLFCLSLLNSRRSQDFTADEPPNDENAIGRFWAESSRDDGKTNPSIPAYEAWVLRLLAAAAAVNSAYFFAKQACQLPINRWEDEAASPGKLGDLSELVRHRWGHARAKLLHASESVRTPLTRASGRLKTRLRAIIHLVNEIAADIDPEKREARISSDRLLTLTEVAWYYLTEGLLPKPSGSPAGSQPNDSYLSWPEVLLAIGLHPRETQDAPGLRTGSRPVFSDPEAVTGGIVDVLEAPSKARADAWESLPDNSGWKDATGSSIDRGYRVYANVLAAQARHSHDCFKRMIGKDSDSRDRVLAAGDHGPPSTEADAAHIDDEVSGGGFIDELDEREGYGDAESALDAEAEPTQPPTPDAEAAPPAQVAPPATAFVTTFDVELELALRHFHSDLPFVVVLPVNVGLGERDHLAATVWLGYLVEPGPPGAALQSITRPPERNWFVVSRGKEEPGALTETLVKDNPYDVSSPVLRGLTAKGPLPFIIRLSGSPLVHLPSLFDSRAQERLEARRLMAEIANALTGEGHTSKDSLAGLQHAVVLEESHSMFLSFPEFDSGRQGLPPKLANYFPEGYWRYWMLLGVQASDDPIRYRLVAQIAGVGGHQTANPNRPKRSGMALNRPNALTRRASDLLRWSDFDIVNSQVESMTEPLEHYLQHLKPTAGHSLAPLVHGRNHRCGLTLDGDD